MPFETHTITRLEMGTRLTPVGGSLGWTDFNSSAESLYSADVAVRLSAFAAGALECRMSYTSVWDSFGETIPTDIRSLQQCIRSAPVIGPMNIIPVGDSTLVVRGWGERYQNVLRVDAYRA